MTWQLALAVVLTATCAALAALFALWAAGRPWPARGWRDFSRGVARTPGTADRPRPVLLGTMAAVMAVAAAVPPGLAQGPAPGGAAFGWPLGGAVFTAIFAFRGLGPYTGRHAFSPERGTAFDRNDRQIFAPLALALAAGFGALTAGWLSAAP